MGLKKKVSKPKTTLAKKAEENTSVRTGTSREPVEVKKGKPLDPHIKQGSTDTKTGTVVGLNLGITKNMDNYESLRVDCWLTDTVKENESVEQAYERILGVIDNQLQSIVNSYTE